jgi:hypothetical protein
VSRTQQRNKELTAVKEEQKSSILNLETSLQNVTNDRDFAKDNLLHLQQVIGEAEERKQVGIFFIRPYITSSFQCLLVIGFSDLIKHFNK